jgi:hypothetical protein
MHTEVNLWVVIDWNIDFLLCLSRAPVVCRWVVVRKRLHRFLDELVALILKALAIAKLSRVNTTTEVIVLWRRRRGSEDS